MTGGMVKAIPGPEGKTRRYCTPIAPKRFASLVKLRILLA